MNRRVVAALPGMESAEPKKDDMTEVILKANYSSLIIYLSLIIAVFWLENTFYILYIYFAYKYY